MSRSIAENNCLVVTWCHHSTDILECALEYTNRLETRAKGDARDGRGAS